MPDPTSLSRPASVGIHADVHRQSYSVTMAQRAALKGQVPLVVWMTGLSGSGKSTLADSVEHRLHQLGRHTYVLDGDNMRTGLNRDLGFSVEDRQENVRRVGEVAKVLYDAGLIVVVALVSPFRADRDAVREQFDVGAFLEVWVDTPASLCQERDPKGLYRKAAAGAITDMTGVGQEYEPPADPELRLAGDGDLAANTETVVRAILSS